MATYRPKLGYSAWEVPPTPVKFKLDWSRIGVWCGLVALCLMFWAVVFVGCARIF